MAVLDALRAEQGPSLEAVFFGPEDRGERKSVEARGVRFERVPAAGVRGRGPLGLARAGWQLLSGIVIAIRKLQAFRPDAVFSTGGYASFPASVAARLLRRPLVVYLPDVSPGWAVRAEKLLATRIATTTEAALQHLPAKKTKVTGYPVRDSFAAVSREEARRQLGLPADVPVVLVAGASQGSRILNESILASLEALLEDAVVVHVTGAAGLTTAEEMRESLPENLKARYLPAAYRDDLPAVMVAADLAVMRAGASVLGELPAAGLPAILVPGTFAGGHQRDNARWLEQNGAAVVLDESEMQGEVLEPGWAPYLAELPNRIREVLADREQLMALRAAAKKLARPEAARDIARLIAEVSQ